MTEDRLETLLGEPDGEDASQPVFAGDELAPSGWRWLWLVVPLGALVAAGLWFWHTRTRAVTPVESAVIARGDIEDAVTALGKLQPRDYVDVGAQASGQLTRIFVRAGEHVKAGQLVAQIDPQLQRAKLEIDRAQLARLLAELDGQTIDLEFAQSKLRRQVDLERDNVTSHDLVEQAEWEVRSAAARIDALKAQVRQIESALHGDEVELGYTRIYAPMTGTVISVEARQGQTLNATQQAPVILRIADLSTMTVWTQVSEADVTRLRDGMELYCTTLGHGDRRWTAQLRQILPAPPSSVNGVATAVNTVVLYTALFDVDNAAGELRPDMSAQVFFIVAKAHDAVLAPMSALGPGAPDGSFHVNVVKSDGQLAARPVRVGVHNRFMAEITSGLEPGEAVQKNLDDSGH
jgi:macrolide-specific efflux system membrane fusion protein